MAFLTLWRASGGPELEKEFRFHPTRKWRADFAHLPSRTLIEIEGGIYVNGRHNRGAGFAADLEKYFEAALAGAAAAVETAAPAAASALASASTSVLAAKSDRKLWMPVM